MKTATSRPILLMLVAAVAVPGFGLAADAETPTFYADVLPVLQENCQTCHRPEGEGENIGGMIAPMPLMTYQQTRPVGALDRAGGREPFDAAVVRDRCDARSVPP